MTKEELAAKLNGREMRKEITRAEAEEAKKDGLLVIYGYSDDNTEFDGLFSDEVGCYDGGTFLIDKEGVLCAWFDIRGDLNEDEARHFLNRKPNAKKIEAVWCAKLPGIGTVSWTYKTDLPHATFDIMEDGEVYCRGIVIDAKDL